MPPVLPPAVTAVAKLKRGPRSPKERQALSHRPLPLIYRQIARKLEVDAVLTAHASGNFHTAAGFADEIMTDDRIAGVIETRAGALLSAPLEIKAARDRRKDKKIAEVIGGVDTQKGVWPRIVSPATLFDLLVNGYLMGFAVAQIIWTTSATEFLPRLVPWPREHIRWDREKRRFVAMTEDSHEIDLPRPDEQPEGDGQWFVWIPKGSVENCWKNGMIRTLGEKYIHRQWNYRDWARHNEKLGLGIFKAMVPSWAEEVDTDAFVEDLSNIGSEAAVMCPQGEGEDGGYDVELVEAQGRGWEGFREFKKEVDIDISVRVLGQNLTTEVSENGARSAVDSHELVRLDKALEDAAIGDAFSAQVLTWYVVKNFGDAALTPLVHYHVEPATDLAKEAQGLKVLGDAVLALKAAEPRVDGITIMEAQGVPLLTEEELARQLEEEAAPEPGLEGDLTAEGDDDTPEITEITGDPTPEELEEIQRQIEAETGKKPRIAIG